MYSPFLLLFNIVMPEIVSKFLPKSCQVLSHQFTRNQTVLRFMVYCFCGTVRWQFQRWVGVGLTNYKNGQMSFSQEKELDNFKQEGQQKEFISNSAQRGNGGHQSGHRRRGRHQRLLRAGGWPACGAGWPAGRHRVMRRPLSSIPGFDFCLKGRRHSHQKLSCAENCQNAGATHSASTQVCWHLKSLLSRNSHGRQRWHASSLNKQMNSHEFLSCSVNLPNPHNKLALFI